MRKVAIVTCAALCGAFAFSGFAAAGEALAQAGDASFAVPLAYRGVEPGQDKVGNVTGTDIQMKAFDHTVAGVINGGIAWGFYDEAGGAARLVMRKYSQVITAEFKRQDGKLGGVITSTDGQSQRSTVVTLAGVDSANNVFKLKLNDEVVAVTVTPESINGGHYVNPTYSAMIGGKPVSYRIEVEGCMGYSIYMGMIMLGAYTH